MQNNPAKGEKLQWVYKRAYQAMAKFPIVLENGQDAKNVQYIGASLAKKLDDRLKKHQSENNIAPVQPSINLPTQTMTVTTDPKPKKYTKVLNDEYSLIGVCVDAEKEQSNKLKMKIAAADKDQATSKSEILQSKASPKKSKKIADSETAGNIDLENLIQSTKATKKSATPKKPKLYIPAYGSGAFAILLALYKCRDTTEAMSKHQIINAAQEHSNTSFAVPNNVSSGNRFTAWSGMRALEERGLVHRHGNPHRYTLGDEGRILARKIYLTNTKSQRGEFVTTEVELVVSDSSVDLELPEKLNSQNSRMDLKNSSSSSISNLNCNPKIRKQKNSLIFKHIDSSLKIDDADINSNLNSVATEMDEIKKIWEEKINSIETVNLSSSPIFNENIVSEAYSTIDSDFESLIDAKMSFQPQSRHSAKNTSQINVMNDGFATFPRPKTKQPFNTSINNLQTQFQELPNFQSESICHSIPIKNTLPVQSNAAKFGFTLLKGTFDIFLVLDNREVRTRKDRNYFQTELSAKGIQVKTCTLALGDFCWIAKLKPEYYKSTTGFKEKDDILLGFIVERKSGDDLISSIKDGRYVEQKVLFF